jgi:hypothetical protein
MLYVSSLKKTKDEPHGHAWSSLKNRYPRLSIATAHCCAPAHVGGAGSHWSAKLRGGWQKPVRSLTCQDEVYSPRLEPRMRVKVSEPPLDADCVSTAPVMVNREAAVVMPLLRGRTIQSTGLSVMFPLALSMKPYVKYLP